MRSRASGVVGLPVVLNIVTKMKLNSQILTTLLIVLGLTTLVASPVFADSRSATVRVSCTILPMLEISTPKTTDQALTSWASTAKTTDKDGLELKTSDRFVSVGTNLGNAYDVAEAFFNRPEGRMKLYSVTAL